MLDVFVTATVTLFLVIDPVGLLPFFIALTADNTAVERRAIALRATLIAALILCIFTLAGDVILRGIGISMPAFRISGGLLLFLTAVEMLFAKRAQRREEQSAEDRPDPSVFPLAIPLIAGPGAIAAVILVAGAGDDRVAATIVALGATGLVLALCLCLFLLATPVKRLLGRIGVTVVTRVLGLLLAALAVQFVVDGLQGLGLV
ncbi:MAG: MarC family protein [Pseudomonadota bacterium]